MLLNSSISFARCHNTTNVGPLAAEIGSGVWGTPASFSEFCVLAFYCSDIVQLRPTKLCTMFGRLLHWYTIYTLFGGFCLLMEFCQVQTSLCVQVLRSPILAALLHDSRPVGVSQTFTAWNKEWNYGTFAPRHFQQTVPPRFRGLPSHWAQAHILIRTFLFMVLWFCGFG